MRILLFIIALAAVAGCASKFERTLEEARTVDEATRQFGEPTVIEKLDDGSTRREWVFQSTEYSGGSGFPAATSVSIGGYWSWFGIWVSNFFDNDSYPSEKYCRMEIISDENGNILQRRWQGDSCDRLLKRGR